MAKLFDTHAHYDDKRFEGIRDEILQSMTSPTEYCPSGVEYIMNVGCKLESSRVSIELAEKYDFVYAAAGFHPHETANMPENWKEELLKLLQHPKVRAIGEIGLDFHYDFSPRDIQKEIFEQQLILAEETGYPVLVHDREAHGPTMDIISRHKAWGVLHSFSGSSEMVKELVKRGWYISYSGSVTFKSAVNLTETVLHVPDDRLLIETDAPYLTPVPYRSKTNTSHYTYLTAQKIADLRHVDVEHIIEVTNQNAKRVFGIE
ncbi:MAG: TatD family deoxyribonuclease [Ruminococcaceae bacterium]|nr:TatD family deoxyribonuclease [Oscillospiraceae bacterium]